jgi:hypothetical protein
MRRLTMVALATVAVMYADAFKVYPGAELSAKRDKTESYSTPDPFSKVAHFYRAIGKEQKMSVGDGKGGAKATFTFDDGVSIVISRPPPINNSEFGPTSIDVHRK